MPDMLALVADWRPDVVVRETMEFASAVAAIRHDVPQVRVGVHLESRVDSAGMLEEIAAPALGVPQAFVPLFVDGPRNAERVAAAGAGIVDLDIRPLLDNPSYGAAARAIADEIRALPSPAESVAVIQRSAAGHAIR